MVIGTPEKNSFNFDLFTEIVDLEVIKSSSNNFDFDGQKFKTTPHVRYFSDIRKKSNRNFFPRSFRISRQNVLHRSSIGIAISIEISWFAETLRTSFVNTTKENPIILPHNFQSADFETADGAEHTTNRA